MITFRLVQCDHCGRTVPFSETSENMCDICPDDPIPGVDYDIACCPNCGHDEHTPAQLKACIKSILCPPPCPTCGAHDVKMYLDGTCRFCR